MSTGGYWSGKAAPIIREVLAQTAGKPDAEVRAALREAYPFGERKYFPYKAWLGEIKRQLGTKTKRPPCSCSHAHGSHRGKCHAADCSCERYAWLHTRECVGQTGLLELHACTGRIEQSHLRDHTGLGLKEPDARSVPMCTGLHQDWEQRKGHFAGWHADVRLQWMLATIELEHLEYRAQGNVLA